MADREFVAASTTAVLGGAGAPGDYLEGLLVIPTSTSPGSITLSNGRDTYQVFAGGAGSLTGLIPFFIPIGLRAAGTGWTLVTGAGVTVLALGGFT